MKVGIGSRFVTCLVVVAFGLVAATQPVAAQDAAAKKMSPAEAIKKSVGVWDATMHMGGEAGGGGEATGVETAELLGDLWVLSKFEMDFGGMPFQGHGVMGYDPNKKMFVSTWVDSMQPFISMMEGTTDESGRISTMLGEWPDQGGTMQKWKSTSEWMDDDHRTFKMFMGDKDGEFNEMMSIDYSRRKDDKPATDAKAGK